MIEILDTAGQEDYQSMLDTWINFAEGFLLVYAINDKESLERLEKTRDRILKLKKGKVCPIVIVGNKCDLENEREIKEDDAKTIAKQWGALHIETSATVFFKNFIIFFSFFIGKCKLQRKLQFTH
jgi:small GTP-binding protein